MPKTLILLLADDPRLAARARRVADAARAVRFAEVDVRAASAAAPAGALAAADYDAVVLGAAGDDTAAARDALRAFDPDGALADRVGAAFGADAADGPACWAALRALAAHGLVLVPPAADRAALVTPAGGATPGVAPGAPDDADRRLGRRVATVAAWVRHARGHDHADGRAHGHAHDGHAHDGHAH